MDEQREIRERRRLASNCFACGERNPIGLQMRFRMEDGVATAEFRPSSHHQGYPGYMHGGLVSTMLDEAMGWATYGQSIWAVTGRMSVRFREPVPVSETLVVKGWIARRRGRALDLRGEVLTREGKLLAEGEGMYMEVRGKRAEEMERSFREQAGEAEG